MFCNCLVIFLHDYKIEKYLKYLIVIFFKDYTDKQKQLNHQIHNLKKNQLFCKNKLNVRAKIFFNN